MSAEAIIDAVHEYMYEKFNDSPETGKEKVRYPKNQKTRFTKQEPDEPAKFEKMIPTVAGHRTGQDSTNVPPEERNVQSVEKSDFSPNAAAQTEK